MSTKQIGKLLNSNENGELAKALKRSEAIGQLTRQLADQLPEELAVAIVAASVDDDGVLSIKTSSSAWASRLRFESAALEGAAQAAGLTIREIRVRVGRSTQA
jgi:hypothetical protein